MIHKYDIDIKCVHCEKRRKQGRKEIGIGGRGRNYSVVTRTERDWENERKKEKAEGEETGSTRQDRTYKTDYNRPRNPFQIPALG